MPFISITTYYFTVMLLFLSHRTCISTYPVIFSFPPKHINHLLLLHHLCPILKFTVSSSSESCLSLGQHPLATLALVKSLCGWLTWAVVFPSVWCFRAPEMTRQRDTKGHETKQKHSPVSNTVHYIFFYSILGEYGTRIPTRCSSSYSVIGLAGDRATLRFIVRNKRSIESSSKIQEINNTPRGLTIEWGGSVVVVGRGRINRGEH